jgi:hypothetical protein
MSKPATPAVPNPVTTANAQTGSNISTAEANSTLGNINQVSPTGSTTFANTGGYTDPTTGQWVPSSTETQSLNPTLTNILSGTENTAQSLLPTAQTLANDASTSTTTPLNVNQTANNATIAGGPQALDQPVATAAFNAANTFLQPQEQQQQTNLQDQLAQQGISVGNPAYNNAETQLMNSQNQTNTAAANNATVTGANQANNMYNLALQGQNQNIAQQQTVQQNPLSLLSQLYSGTNTATSGVA